MGLQAVESNAHWGIYVWEMNNGQPFTDGNGGVMNIPGRRFDLEKMSLIAQAARHYGAPDGQAKFLAGVQRSSEMRHSEEVDRMKQGYIPSETDIGAFADAQRAYNAARAAGVDYDRD